MPESSPHTAIAAACRRWSVTSLAVVGSTDGPAVALVAEFEPGRVPGLIALGCIEADLAAA